MDDQPWKSEVSLTAEIARAVLREQFPGVCDGPIRHLGEGWDSVAYLVSGQWVFRFPKRRDVETRMQREVRLLDALVGRLPLPVPDVRWRGQPGLAFPFHFMGYRLLPGTQAHETDLPARGHAAAARDLGRFLTALHAVAVPRLVEIGFDAGPENDHATTLFNEARRLTDRVDPYLPPDLREAARAILDGRITPPMRYGGPWRVIHRDLQAEHILLSPDGVVAGVIDFGDATVGDPAVDFVGCYAWQGPAFAREVLRSYGQPTDALFWERVRFMGQCCGLIGVGWVDKTDAACLATHLRFLRNAFVQP
jgi:aminoglycoside phosphotransferase (APT) family kinase protein